MKKLLLFAFLLTTGISAHADGDPKGGAHSVARKYTILGACNLTLTTTAGTTYYYYVSTDHEALLQLRDSCVVLNGDTYRVDEVKSMTLRSMPRYVVNEDSTFYNTTTELNHGLVALRRSLVLNQWNDICLPFNLTGQEVTTVFGDSARLAGVRGVSDEEAATVELEELQLATSEVVLKKGYHYLLLPTQEPDVAATSRLSFGDRPYGPIWLVPNVSIAKSTRALTSKYYNADSTTIVSVHGTFNRLDNTYKIGSVVRNKKVKPEGYYFDDETATVKQTADSLTLGGLRVWMEDLSAEKVPLHVVLTHLDGTREELTGTAADAIGLIREEGSRTVTDSSAIYDLTGRRVKRVSTPGIYIIDGKKVYVIK